MFNHKKAQRLTQLMEITALYPKTNTVGWGKGRKVYPHQMKMLTTDRPNQVWATDKTYLPMARDFVWLVAWCHWYSREFLA